MADSTEGTSSSRSRGLSPAIIAAIATVLAAVIGGVFVLISQKSSNDAPTTQTEGPLRSGEAVPPPGSTDDKGTTFLTDTTPVPGHDLLLPQGVSDSVGGRGIIKAIRLYSGDTAEYPIPPSAKVFKASVGLSDEGANDDPHAPAGVFSVYGDGTLLWQQSLNRGFLATVSLPLKGHRVIRLGFSNNWIGDFGLARFTQ